MTYHVDTVVKVTVNSYICVPTDPSNWNRVSREINPTPTKAIFELYYRFGPQVS